MPLRFTNKKQHQHQSSAEKENDELEALIQNGDVDAAMGRLDNSIDSPCERVFISSAIGCRSILINEKEFGDDHDDSAVKRPFSLIVTAAKSLCPKQPTVDEKEMTLDVIQETTEEDCQSFFNRGLSKISAEREAEETSNKITRLYIALDDNASQNLKPVLLPFANFLKSYLAITAASNSNVLVHCVLGRSRSVALVAGYMMFSRDDQQRNRMLADVMDEIRKVRAIAEVNPVFGAQIFAIWRREMLKAQKKEE